MAEVLVEFENTWTGPDGKTYEARACGREREDRLWEGWIEFTPTDGSAAVQTERETTQPNREDTLYWASGLTYAYIDGALWRMLKPLPRLTPRQQIRARPAFEQPAQRRPQRGSEALGANAVLDPFAVYRESDTVLRGQLNALDEGQLRNIVREYQMSKADPTQLTAMSRQDLISIIMTTVQQRAA
jgi:hypothetical protein